MMTCHNLKASFQLFSKVGSNKAEIRDAAQGGRVVFAGTYRQCVAEAKRRGVWYS